LTVVGIGALVSEVEFEELGEEREDEGEGNLTNCDAISLSFQS
jgi:hypothetical protein